VVVFVPVALGAPAVFVFVPPLMEFAPAMLAGLAQFATFVIGLAAVASVFLDGLVEFMFGVLDATLTPFLAVFGVKARHGGEKQNGCEYGSRKYGRDCGGELVRANHEIYLVSGDDA
jgi:hypothetical protein